MDFTVKTKRKYKRPVPKIPHTGNSIDWEAYAKHKNYKSVKAMFDDLYADSAEKIYQGKRPIYKLAAHLGVSYRSLRRELLKQGYKTDAVIPKTLRINRPRSVIAYPYVKLGFKTEYDMWVSFIERGLKAKAIQKIFEEKIGRYFTLGTVNTSLGRARQHYKNRLSDANIKKLDTM